MILVTCLGHFGGAVTKRWGGWGVFVLTVADILVVGGLAVVISVLDGWVAVADWFARSLLPIVTGWLLVPAALAAAGAWLIMRRTVP
jgi:hypothetical protein